LQSIGFIVEQTQYVDVEKQTKVNLVAHRGPMYSCGPNTGGLAYFCHSDVVPAEDWTGPGGDPFSPVVTSDRLFGRGACDMKGSLVAMLTAASRMTANDHHAPMWFVCTADEETGFAGAKHLVEHSAAYRELAQAQPVGIIGEPTNLSVVHAHKGITGFKITSRGRAAHSSTSGGVNSNIAMVPMLALIAELEQRTREDSRYHDSRFDPPTLSWNFGVSDRATAINITPSRTEAWVSLRTMPEIDGEDLIEVVRQRAEALGLEFRRYVGGGHVWVDSDAACIRTMCKLAGGIPETVCYSTDGGQFTELKQLVVIGPGDIAQAHTSDEWISLDQLARGIEVYEKAIRRWCCERG
jgi:acetylornithine deacetylase